MSPSSRRADIAASPAPDTAPVFAALGDASRLAIIRQLCEAGPLPTILLRTSDKKVSRQGLTKHLRILESAGLVGSFRVGRDRHWAVRAEEFAAMRSYLDAVTRQWEARLERLRMLVEDGAPAPDATI